MRQKKRFLFLRAQEARVVEVLGAEAAVRVALTLHHPRDGETEYGESVVPLAVFPPELLRPGTDVWLIGRRTVTEWVDLIGACPRTSLALPAEYRQAMADSDNALAEYLAQLGPAEAQRQVQLYRCKLVESLRDGGKVGHDFPAVWSPHNQPMHRTGPAV